MKNKHPLGLLLLAFLLAFLPCRLPVHAARLAAPKLLKIQNVSGGVQLTWKKVAGASGYCIYKKLPGTSYRKVTVIDKGKTTSFIDKGVFSNVSYVYSIKAYKKGKSSKNSVLQKKTLSITYCEEPVITSLLDTDRGIRICWDPLYCSGYYLYRREGDGKYKMIAAAEGQEQDSYVDTSVEEGVTYTYTIRSYAENKGKRFYSTMNAEGWEASHSSSASPTEEDPIIYRAFLIGESRYDYIRDPERSYNLYGPPFDVRAMQNLLEGMNYSRVKVSENIGRSQILRGISEAFEEADSNDVSLFYYTGHGSTDPGKKSGALMLPSSGSQSELLTLRELADTLGQIPGKVIVILDSCGSGAGIDTAQGQQEGSVTPSYEDADDNDTFPLLVRQAFFHADSSHLIKYGELTVESKFYVITSSSAHQVSIERNVGKSVNAGLMTYGIVTGGGFSYSSGGWNGTLPADSSGDGAVSLEEAYTYASEWIAKSEGPREHQTLHRFPEFSSFPLYGKRGAVFP